MTTTLKVATIVFFLAVLLSCGSSAAPTSDSPQAFTGDGGKGISIAVLVPDAQGLSANQNYLPTMIQGVLVNNLSSYSAITVLDRLRLETVLKETESGIYKNESDFGRLGQITNVDYVLTGNITRTSTGHALQIQVVGTKGAAIGRTRASYSGTPTIAEMDNFTGIRKASLELLTQMDVKLTDRSRRELSGASSREDVNSQTALSRGIVAQRGGNEFEAMFNYFDARTFNANIPEASVRMSSAATTLAANNMQNTSAREQVLSEIQRMREEERLKKEREKNFDELLKKATTFYKAHQPFRITMHNTFTYGNIDHKKGTVDIEVEVRIAEIREEMAIIDGLAEQAKSILGVYNWPYNYRFRGYLEGNEGKAGSYPYLYYINDFGFYREKPTRQGIWDYTSRIDPTTGRHISSNRGPNFNVEAVIINEQGKTLNRVSFNFKDFGSTKSEEKSFTIKADDLTDTLTMRIVSVNGKSFNSIRQSGYLDIPQESMVLKAQAQR